MNNKTEKGTFTPPALNMKQISKGVCAPIGFTAAGIHCGIRKNKTKKDLALIVSEVRAAAAAVYTTNLVKGAPIAVTKDNLADGYAQAMICNSGNANTCNANGIEIAQAMCDLVAQHLPNISANDVIVTSTGVIGQELNIAPIADGMPTLVSQLSTEGNDNAAAAIMTTDLREKQIAYSFTLPCGTECKIGAIAKGSGMININMATMLGFVTTDIAITPEMLSRALTEDTKRTFNMVSVDGDTSTNDQVSIMANGMAGNKIIDSEGADFDAFCAVLAKVNRYLAREIARDGEGATKLLTCRVSGAKCQENASIIAKSVISSSLVKAMMFGEDANCGRVLCAIGYSGAQVDVTKIDVNFQSELGSVQVCKSGLGLSFDEEVAAKVLSAHEVDIVIDLGDGDGVAEAWGCDLTYDYVKINGDYRS